MSKAKKSSRSALATSRQYLSQADVPAYSLEQALRVPTAICENYGGASVTPLRLAEAMLVQPTSGPFRSLCGASIAYGLTDGGSNAATVSLEALGKRILRPTEDGDDLSARREAILRPRVIREFLQKYDGSSLPRMDIATNVLTDMGVPREKARAVFDLILENAQSVGFLRTIKDRQYIDLAGCELLAKECESVTQTQTADGFAAAETANPSNPSVETVPIVHAAARSDAKDCSLRSDAIVKRVYITHGKNRAFIDTIKKLLGFGELIPVVSVETQSVSKPVPQKVMDEMRSCGAAIIHVEPERDLDSSDENGPRTINPNVLIEIGAAMALFGNRFILLVRDGIQLPSNLQGLFVERYEGSTLDAEVTIRLFEAINSIKKTPMPDRYMGAERHG
jgi:predicted nucleotide-binding protein